MPPDSAPDNPPTSAALRAHIKMALDVIGPYPFPPPHPQRGDCIDRKMLRRIQEILMEALDA